MTYGELQDLLEVEKNKYSFDNLLSMIIKIKPADLIELYNKYIKGEK